MKSRYLSFRLPISIAEEYISKQHSNRNFTYKQKNRLRRLNLANIYRVGVYKVFPKPGHPKRTVLQNTKLYTSALISKIVIKNRIYTSKSSKFSPAAQKTYIYPTVYILVNLKKFRLRRKNVYIPNRIYTSQPLYTGISPQGPAYDAGP